MPLGDDKTTITAVIPGNLKEKLRMIAKVRRWTLSQAIGALIEDSIDRWVDDLGVSIESENSQKPTKTRKKPSSS